MEYLAECCCIATSWLVMLFAAGMGIGLLCWGMAEPLTHYLLIADDEGSRKAAGLALFVPNFHWGLHILAIYALIGLAIGGEALGLGAPWTAKISSRSQEKALRLEGLNLHG